MEFNTATTGERLHISFFGMRNAGKSSLVNAITGQSLSVVSEIKGTTTDPVKKAMELLPLGPVLIIDTPGLDDEGTLGELRIQKTQEVLRKTDLAVLVTDALQGLSPQDKTLLTAFKERKLPYLIAYNKADLLSERAPLNENAVYVSAKTGEGLEILKNALGRFAEIIKNPKRLVADLISPGDLVLLVIPIDESAPKGRLILPQQMVIRDILDAHGMAITCQETELKQTLSSLSQKPKLVICDSQVFSQVAKDTPEDILLTSFSILMARYKGDLKTLVQGVKALQTLKDGDQVLISEGCTHHRQCGDIGTVKLPQWIRKVTGVSPAFSFTSGGEFPEDLSPYRLIIHCGGCMLNEAEMTYRINLCRTSGIPIVNYGVAISWLNGILFRSLQVFPDILSLLEKEPSDTDSLS